VGRTGGSQEALELGNCLRSAAGRGWCAAATRALLGRVASVPCGRVQRIEKGMLSLLTVQFTCCGEWSRRDRCLCKRRRADGRSVVGFIYIVKFNSGSEGKTMINRLFLYLNFF